MFKVNNKNARMTSMTTDKEPSNQYVRKNF